MSFSRYPKYRESGADWLGDVPDHWEVKPLRHISTIRKGRLPDQTFPMPTTETDLPYLSMEYLRGESESPAFVSSSSRSVLAGDGDILILWDGSNAGEFLRAKQGVVSSTVALVEPENVRRDFLFFACKALERRTKDQTVGMGIPHVSGEELRTCAIACPSPAEQTAIAEFLDRETGKIDELVAEQKRLMELLKEKRQAVISHAVTRGLNPAAPLKTSGIEWLGDAPAHWEVIKLSRLATKIGDGLHGTPEYVNESPFRFINGNNLIDCSIALTESTRCVSESEFEKHRVELDQTSILLSINGTIGNLALFRGEPVMLGKSAAYVNCGKDLRREYLCFYLRSSFVNCYFDHAVTGTTIFNLSLESVRRLPVALPPIDEQKAIVAHLDAELAKFNTLTAEAQRAIDLLQERRSALISAAVTGQIDVRPLLAKEAA